MIIVVSGGEYSDYWEQWYETEGSYTHASLGEKLREEGEV